ncbi:peptide MFS transporter [Limnoglobus roseus]|uniref:peptide MFS transporter n=1 Tax=Limnoglobus roseus TaxID=2598579 RepID=UPI001FEA4D0D|nr:MFS transporter [Limnoglobus roseus]
MPTAAELHDVTKPAAIAPTNHPIGFWFFFWGEFAERCSYYGMRAILALYMTEKLGVDKSDAGTYMSLFIAACYFFPLIGGWVADNFLGKYWTIVLFSVPYVAAQFLVGIEDKALVFGSLLLLAMGSGVIKPNISTLMGLTYDQQRPGQDQLRTSAFSWFYMAINIGAFLSQVAMPYLRTTYSYQTAFLFPAGLMSLALMIFAAGKRFYATESITRKVVGDPNSPPPADTRTVTGIPVHTKLVTPEEKAADTKLKLQTLGRIGALFLTVMFFWAIFDQSASTWIFFANTYMDCTLFGTKTPPDSIQAFNPLFIVALVPLSVMLFKAFPVKATSKIALGFLLTGVSMAIMSLAGFMAGQATKANKITFPEGELVLPHSAATLSDVKSGEVAFGGVKITATDWAYNTDKKKLEFTNGIVTLTDGRVVKVSGGHTGTPPAAAELSAGGVLEPLMKSADELKDVKSDAAKAAVEEIDWVKPAERVTVWWQVFAYLILTVAEILVSITGLELAFVAAPPTMKSFVTACWLAVVFLANLLINAPITRLYPTMSPGVYFAMLGGAMLLILTIYAPIAGRFNRLMAEAKTA